MPRQSQRSVSHVGHLSHAAAGRRRVGHRCEELIALAPCALHTATHSRSVPFPPVTSEPCHNPAIPRSVTRAAHAHQLAHQLHTSPHTSPHTSLHTDPHTPLPRGLTIAFSCRKRRLASGRPPPGHGVPRVASMLPRMNHGASHPAPCREQHSGCPRTTAHMQYNQHTGGAVCTPRDPRAAAARVITVGLSRLNLETIDEDRSARPRPPVYG